MVGLGRDRAQLHVIVCTATQSITPCKAWRYVSWLISPMTDSWRELWTEPFTPKFQKYILPTF